MKRNLVIHICLGCDIIHVISQRFHRLFLELVKLFLQWSARPCLFAAGNFSTAVGHTEILFKSVGEKSL